MGSMLDEAVRNNAEWCDLLCRAHGVFGRIDDRAWTSRDRTPPFYPDAVTLRRGVPVPDVLARVDSSPGCSVKDSFADLDLGAEGFDVLIEGEWLWRAADDTVDGAAPAADHAVWRSVATEEELTLWSRAWGEEARDGLFPSALLADDRLTFLLGVRDGDVVAGCILNISGPVVGLSNVFGPPDEASLTWRGAVAATVERFPTRPVVGYQSGDGLTVAVEQGFRRIAALRVWRR